MTSLSALKSLVFRVAIYIIPLIISAYLFLPYPNKCSYPIDTMSLSSKLSITDVDLKGERVLIRVDFNVP